MRFGGLLSSSGVYLPYSVDGSGVVERVEASLAEYSDKFKKKTSLPLALAGVYNYK